MGKKLIIKGADFFANAISSVVSLYESDIMSSNQFIIQNGVAKANTTGYKGGFIDIRTYSESELVIKTKASATFSRISFVTALPSQVDEAIQFASGYSASNMFVEVSTGSTSTVNVPSNANYIYVMYYNSGAGGNIFPEDMYLK